MSTFEESKRIKNDTLTVGRRDFAKMALGGATLLSSAGGSSAKLLPIPPGVKIAAQAMGGPTEENMLYLKQLGVTWLSIYDPKPETSTTEGYTKFRQQWEAGGFKVYNECTRVAPNGNAILNVPAIVLNLPGRDERIEEFLNYLRYLGKAGIPYMTYGFEVLSAVERTPGGRRRPRGTLVPLSRSATRSR